jgi:hypothetical protein
MEPAMPRLVGPFSVPDPDATGWDEMIRQNQLLQAGNSSLGPQNGRPEPVDDANLSHEDWRVLRARQLSADHGQLVDGSGDDELVGGDGDDQVQLQPSQGGSRLANALPRYGSAASSDLSGTAPEFDFSKHPGLIESSIPVWGSAREAIADGYDGNYVGALGNAALAATDFFLPEEAIVRGLSEAGVKAALKDGASMTWKNVRARMGRAGHFAVDEQGHHWAIPNRWTLVPDFIRNHPMNIKVLPADIHKRVHFNDHVNGLPKFSFWQAAALGTPEWAKDLATWTAVQLSGKAANAGVRAASPK